MTSNLRALVRLSISRVCVGYVMNSNLRALVRLSISRGVWDM